MWVVSVCAHPLTSCLVPYRYRCMIFPRAFLGNPLPSLCIPGGSVCMGINCRLYFRIHERDIILPLLTVRLSIKLCYRTVSKRIHVSYIFGRFGKALFSPTTVTIFPGNPLIGTLNTGGRDMPCLMILRHLRKISVGALKVAYSGRALDLRSTVREFRLPASALSGSSLGKLCTHMCLCHKAVLIWCTSVSWGVNRRSGVALSMRVTDNSGITTSL